MGWKKTKYTTNHWFTVQTMTASAGKRAPDVQLRNKRGKIALEKKVQIVLPGITIGWKENIHNGLARFLRAIFPLTCEQASFCLEWWQVTFSFTK